MSQYSRPLAQPMPPLGSDARICAACGRQVWTTDRYCPGCGVAFGAAPARGYAGNTLPGFSYHLVQGLGWGLGFAIAAGIVTVGFWLLVGLVVTALR